MQKVWACRLLSTRRGTNLSRLISSHCLPMHIISAEWRDWHYWQTLVTLAPLTRLNWLLTPWLSACELRIWSQDTRCLGRDISRPLDNSHWHHLSNWFKFFLPSSTSRSLALCKPIQNEFTIQPVLTFEDCGGISTFNYEDSRIN